MAAWDVGLKATAQRREDFGVFGEEGFGGSEFIDNGGENFLLVLDAVHIAGAVGFALTGVAESASAVKMVRNAFVIIAIVAVCNVRELVES